MLSVPTERPESPKEVALEISVTTDEKPKSVEEEVSFEVEETIEEKPKEEEMTFDVSWQFKTKLTWECMATNLVIAKHTHAHTNVFTQEVSQL